jgi:hypothetical protein
MLLRDWKSSGHSKKIVSSLDRRKPGQNELTLSETLHHALKVKTKAYIIDFIV